MDEAERASKAWLNMLGTLPRKGFFYGRRPRAEKPKVKEYRWYKLADGREVYRPVADEHDLRSHLAAPQIAPDYQMYQCPITDKPVEGRVAHRENLKQHGCRVLEKGEVEQDKKDRPKMLEEKLRKDVRECTLEACREHGNL